MSLTSNRPPFATPLKGAYTTHDLHRQATLHKIPISPPASFPISTILAMRTLCVIQRDHPNKLQAAVAALYTAYWVEGKRIDSAAVVSEALSLVLSPELVHEMMEGAGGYGKEALTENTKVAVETGCFGLPWFVGELRRRHGLEGELQGRLTPKQRRIKMGKRTISGDSTTWGMWRGFWVLRRRSLRGVGFKIRGFRRDLTSDGASKNIELRNCRGKWRCSVGRTLHAATGDISPHTPFDSNFNIWR